MRVTYSDNHSKLSVKAVAEGILTILRTDLDAQAKTQGLEALKEVLTHGMMKDDTIVRGTVFQVEA